jgi:hypothetical protein
MEPDCFEVPVSEARAFSLVLRCFMRWCQDVKDPSLGAVKDEM